MPSALDKTFGLPAKGLQVFAERNKLIASNIANADTPNYRAKDVDFRDVMTTVVTSSQGTSMSRSHPNHIGISQRDHFEAHHSFRTGHQQSADGNTVDTQMEKVAFAENSVRYQASLDFLNGRIRSIISAIRGE